jgi:uncharacterized membrane protein YhaH (DUF805 family)
MGPAEAIRTCVTKSFQFSGRASRPEFWWFAAFTAAVIAISPPVPLERNGILTFSVLVSLILLVPNLAAGSRRFQDVGRSRWLFLTLTMITLVCNRFAFDLRTFNYANVTTIQLIAFAATWAVNLWTFSILIDNSTRGTNPYGPNPSEASK